MKSQGSRALSAQPPVLRALRRTGLIAKGEELAFPQIPKLLVATRIRTSAYQLTLRILALCLPI
jgi:hypothetical protein